MSREFEIFSSTMGISTRNYVPRILKLMRDMRSREVGVATTKSQSSSTTKFDCEMTRLECSVNYGKKKARSGKKGSVLSLDY